MSNNLVCNALSAKNVRTHGMSSEKWTTKDKIIQYKGLVNLYKRDRQITEVDTAVASKRQIKGLQDLKKSIETDRIKLDNAIAGDKQTLRNVLAEHRELQLAYQNTDPKKVIEDVEQVNFTRRKVLDKLHYQLKLKSKALKELKLEKALLEDRLTYADYNMLKEEKQSKIITGKVQDALLKKEAALAIQQTYHQIIDVMKKDALYFDGILLTVQNDYWYQCRCILNAAKQGQLATEYKNDREQEYVTLERAVREDMKTQKFDLENVREHAESLHNNLKLLLRRDSDLTTCVKKVKDTQEFEQLKVDLDKIETTLRILKDTTMVSSFEMIYPSLQEQMRQKKRLSILAKKCERNKDTILNKLNHAQLMSHVLENTMVETTFEYKARKNELLEQISQEEEKKRLCERCIDLRNNLIAQARISLRQIQQLCKPVRVPGDMRDKEKKSKVRREGDVVAPDEEETDGRTLVVELRPKLSYLASCAGEKLDDAKTDAAYKYFELLMDDRKIEKEVEIISDEDAFDMEGFSSENAHLLTREDIKRISDEIVAANSKDEDMIVIIPTKKKRKKF